MPRGSRKYETMCTVCDELVGVIYTPFNRQNGGGFAPIPKTSRHLNLRTKHWCRGSQLAIPMAMMIPAREGVAA